jgi:hypothetical protein
LTEKPNTNLASEFFVVSQLFRLGYLPLVTLGNTKQIDVVVKSSQSGRTDTVDVKSLTRRGGNWRINAKREKPDHFFVLVYFEQLDNLKLMPRVFVVPSVEIKSILKGDAPYVYPKHVPQRYADAWELLGDYLR